MEINQKFDKRYVSSLNVPLSFEDMHLYHFVAGRALEFAQDFLFFYSIYFFLCPSTAVAS